MKLEVGNQYRNRNGKVVKIIRQIDEGHRFIDDTGGSYTEDGAWFTYENVYENFHRGLIELVVTAANENYQHTINKSIQQISKDLKYQTRDGRPVDIIDIRLDFKKAVIGGVGKDLMQWYIDGRYEEHGESHRDLILIETVFRIDDAVLVKDSCDSSWYKAHFSGYSANPKYKYSVFGGGKTSHTQTSKHDVISFEQCILWNHRTSDMKIR